MAKSVLQVARRLAKSRGGVCVEAVDGDPGRFVWRCSKGHQWRMSLGLVMLGAWCHACRGEACRGKPGVVEARMIAAERGGECLSDSTSGSRSRLRWRCERGHEWEAVLDNVRRLSWCPECAGRGQTLLHMEALARAKGGTCLSSEYEGALVPLRWRCAAGHEWEATPNAVKYGRWCPSCRRRFRVGLEAVRADAVLLGGECLAERLETLSDVVRFRCAEGHEWNAVAACVRRGVWCPVCAVARRVARGQARRMLKARRIARLKGGLCLSSIVVSGDALLDWRCGRGHEFRKTLRSVSRGLWCPSCRRGLGSERPEGGMKS